MQVEDLLSGRLAVRQEEINAVAGYSGMAYRPAHAGGRGEEVPAGSFVRIGQTGEVLAGNDHHLTRVERRDIHEGEGDIVTVDETGRSFTIGDIAENAITHLTLDFSQLYDAQVLQLPELQLEQELPLVPAMVLETPLAVTLKQAKELIFGLEGFWHLGQSAVLSA